MTTSYPIWRLRPKKSALRFLKGDPWVYANELVLDRRSKNVPAGEIVQIQDNDHRPFAIAASNSGSKIAARVLDLDPDAVIDPAWFEARIAKALDLRKRLYPTPHYRLIHAEADGLPGLIVDRFDDTLVVQPNAAWADARVSMISDALHAVTGAGTIYKNASGRGRKLEGLDERSELCRGRSPGIIHVPMNGATYCADLEGGQKTGLFFDQRDNHAFAGRLARDAKVLDVFSHVGGFALATLAAGAASAHAIDASQPALDLAAQGASASGFSDRFTARKGDGAKTMAELRDAGETYDIVICDPPAFAPSKEALKSGLRGYEKIASLAARLVSPDGYLVLCSCSQAATPDLFRAACLAGIERSRRKAQLINIGAAGPDHPVHPRLGESSYLKALFFRLA